MSKIFKFMDWGTDTSDWPVPVGSVRFFRWCDLHVGPNKFDFSPIHRALDEESKLVTSDGKPKTMVVMVVNHLKSYGTQSNGFDCTPTWIYDLWDRAFATTPRPNYNGRKVGHVLSRAGSQFIIPQYDDKWYFWWPQLEVFVQELAKTLKYDERVAAVHFGPGMDGETKICPDEWKGVLPGGVEYRFGELTRAYPRWHTAFVGGAVPAFYSCTPGDNRQELAEVCKTVGVGVKHSGLYPDHESHHGYNLTGTWDHIAWCNENGVPVWIETAHWFGLENIYWLIPAALHYRPVGVNLHSEILDAIIPAHPSYLQTLEICIGEDPSIYPTPPWVVLRDMEYPLKTWTGSDGVVRGYSGHPGDWTFGITMREGDAVRVNRVSLPSYAQDRVYGRQCRLVKDATFDIAQPLEEGMGWEVTVEFVNPDFDNTLTLCDAECSADSRQQLAIGPVLGTPGWVGGTFKAVPWSSFRLYSPADGVFVHAIHANQEMIEEPEPPETAEPPRDWLNAPLATRAEKVRWYLEYITRLVDDGRIDEALECLLGNIALAFTVEEDIKGVSSGNR